MLGHDGRQRARQHGQEVRVADCVPFSSRYWQSEQVDYCAGISAQPGSGDNKQARPVAVRCLVHAGKAGIAAAVAADADHRSGAVRCDAALFMPPDVLSKPRRGRPKTYGIKMTPDAIRNLPLTEFKLTLYGKEQLVRLRTVVAITRFLTGALVRAVWCEFYDTDKQCWSKTRLLLAIETELSAEEILHLYARRWGIEPLFHNLKRWWGVNNLWQQKRTMLELWMQIRSTAWTLVQLLSLVAEEAFPVEIVAPWRNKQPLTGGLVVQ